MEGQTNNEYEEYEQEESSKKFKIKRWMVIVGILLLIIVILSIVVISIVIKSKKPVVTETDYKTLESRMEEEAPIYVESNNLDIEQGVKIDLKDLELDLIATKYCDGYVDGYVEDKEEIYNAYIKCKDGYKTKGYKEAGSNEDTKKPVIKLKGNSTITIKENEEFKDPGATATDDVDGDITKNIKTKGTVDTKKPGKYTITYTVSDKAGNKATKKREVVVVKSETTTSTSTTTTVSTTTTTPTKKTNARTTRRVTTRVNTTKAPVTTTKVTAKPTITLKGERTVTINKGSVYTDPGYTAKDALGNNITSRVTVNSNLNTNVKGTYTIKYSVVDGYGNVSNTAIRYVIVKDTVSSVSVSISPNSMSLSVGESKRLTAYLSPSSSSATITWTSTDPSVAIVSNGLVTAKKKGSTTITASVGNSKSTSLITVK